MLLREMTSSAYAHSFKRFAQGALAGFALAVGLTACGGGGGGTAAPTTPQMTIEPVDFASAIEAAPTITSGETVTGTLESSDDVKYYWLEVAETSTIELTLDAEADIEIALLDSHEAVLATAVTASEANASLVVRAGRYIVRVTDRAKGRVQKGFSFVSKVVAVAGNIESVINIIKGIPKVDLNAFGGRAVLDLTDYFRAPGDEVPEFKTAKFGAGIAGLSLTVEDTRLTIRPNAQVGLGVIRVTVEASIPGIPGAVIPFSVEVGVEGLRAKPQYAVGGRAFGGAFTVSAGGSGRTESLKDYFEYQLDAGSPIPAVLAVDLIRRWTYTAAIQPDPDGGSVVGWAAEIIGSAGADVLKVDAPSGADAVSSIAVDVTVKDRSGGTAQIRFTFSTDNGDSPGGMQPGGTRSPTGFLACLYDPEGDGKTCKVHTRPSVSGGCFEYEEQVTSCPPGAYEICDSPIYIENHLGVILYKYPNRSGVPNLIGC